MDDIAIPETDVVIDLPAPKPQDRTEMNIDRNIATAKKASRDWDKDKVLFSCSLLHRRCRSYVQSSSILVQF